jgi:hypothetical protein
MPQQAGYRFDIGIIIQNVHRKRVPGTMPTDVLVNWAY